MKLRFIIYGLLGWNIEILWTGFCDVLGGNPDMMGHTSLWMFFIYSLAGALFEGVHNRIRGKRWYERGLIWVYLIFSVEFISGFVLSLAGIYAWQYDGLFNVFGFIRLDYAPLWFTVGLIFERIHDFALEKAI